MGGPWTSFGTDRVDLLAAWRDRLQDAEALRNNARFAAAIAMGLYALEICLKERICRTLDVDRLPRGFEIHDLAALLVLAGMSRRIQAKNLRKVRKNRNELVDWAKSLTDLRYTASARWSQQDADRFFNRLNGPADGVLTWLSNQP